MGFHDHKGGHGRVFRGLKKEGRKMVPINKRQDDDTEQPRLTQRPGRDRPVMRIPEGFPPELAQKAQDSNYDVETVYENVIVTMPQTFDGEPQFFTTLPPASSATSAARSAAQTTSAADNSRKQNDDDDDDEQTPSRRPAAQSTATSSSASAESTASKAITSDKDEASSTSSATEVTSSSITTGDGTSVHGAMLADNTSSMVGSNALEATQSASPSAEPEKSGMNGGAKAGLAMGIIFGLALVFGLLFFCWRRKKSQQGLEAYNEKSGAAAAAPPQVNRFSSDSLADRRTSTHTSATAPRLSLRPVTQFLPNLTGENRKSIGNVFGAGATPTDKQVQQSPEQNPFGDAAVLSEKQANSPDGSDKSHDRANSVNSDSSVPATPGSTQLATAAAVPVPRGPNNVHRVQLDFKPSMEDELELKSGQLVRMLHEYDDGWALCSTMDRSKKGVVPRTCLSKMPVKPRGPPPQNRPPPGGPNAAPSPPPSAGNGAVPRPLTSGQQGRQRAPTLDGVPARKPVPGQAL